MTAAKTIVKRCQICGLNKPLAEFTFGSLNLSSLAQVKKYSHICKQCHDKTKNRFVFDKSTKQDKFFLQDEDDDTGSRGKGKRLTVDYHAKLFVTRQQAKQTAQIRQAQKESQNKAAPAKGMKR